MKVKCTENIIHKYLSRYADDDNVIAIVITGSVGKGCSDCFSDVDYVKIVKKRERINGFKEIFGEMVFDCRIETYTSLKKYTWTMNQFYAFINGWIYFDKDCVFKTLLEDKKAEWDKFIKKYVAIHLVEISVNIRFPESYEELQVPSTHFEKFVKRKDYYSALNCLKIIERQLIELCYVSNKYPIPDSKNLMRNIEELDCYDALTHILFSVSKFGDFNELLMIYCNYIETLKTLLLCVEKNFVFEKGYKWYYYKYRGKIS